VLATCFALVACKAIPELRFYDDTVVDGAPGSSDGGPSAADTGAADAAATAACRCDDAGCGACPAAATVALGAFRVDATEVTAVAYDAFLRAGVAPQSLTQDPPQCAWNESYARGGSSDNEPAVNVDWCDAWAYCAWARKRLCGRIGGGVLAASELADPAKDEWYHACSANKPPPAYPYGSSLDTGKCNGKRGGGGPGGGNNNRLDDVKESPACRGTGAPFDEVFDMSGNAAEWVNACSGAAGAIDSCRVRGGSFETDDPSCHATGDARARTTRSGQIGFRCCAEL